MPWPLLLPSLVVVKLTVAEGLIVKVESCGELVRSNASSLLFIKTLTVGAVIVTLARSPKLTMLFQAPLETY